MRSTVAAVFAAVCAVAVVGAGCTPCRRIETKPIALDCAQNATFLSGELHMDSAATFRSFLTDRCLPEATDGEIDDLVGAVDFSTDAVFVARGNRGGAQRCITERATESVDVCEGGLRVVFADRESGEGQCGGKWTIAFSLPRDDLRSAVDDGDSFNGF